jgi:hypothetical protein
MNSIFYQFDEMDPGALALTAVGDRIPACGNLQSKGESLNLTLKICRYRISRPPSVSAPISRR